MQFDFVGVGMASSIRLTFIWITIIGLSVFIIQDVTSSPGCTYHFREYCVTYENAERSITDAQEYCKQQGGALATVKDSETATYLWTMAEKVEQTLNYNRRHYGYGSSSSVHYPWVGSVKKQSSSDEHWKFDDGTILNKSMTINDLPHNAEDYEVLCLMLQNNQLYYISCEAQRKYICQMKGKQCPLTKKTFADSFSYEVSCMQNYDSDLLLPPMTQIPVICKKGFIILGDDQVTCLANGSWDFPNPCIPGCNPPEVSDSVKITDLQESYKINDTILVLCKNGFFGVEEEIKTHLETTCLPDGQWTIRNFECTNIGPSRQLHNTAGNGIAMISPGSQVTLKCSAGSLENQWIKNQKVLANFNSNYEVGSDGQLTINNFSVEDTGFYTCVSSGSRYSTYDLQLSTPCKDNTEISNFNHLENSTVILECNGTINASDIKWFKNNERFWGGRSVKIFKDGMILFENIEFSDAGQYVCSFYDKINKCSHSTTTTVEVYSKNNCGLLKGNSMLSSQTNVPWLAVLWWPSDFMPFCYGTLISDRWVMTSASCLFGSHRRKKPGFIVKLGKELEDMADLENSSSVISSAGAVVIHPNFSRRLNHNDVGLVRLETPITISNDHYPICLPKDPPLADPNSCAHKTLRKGYLSGYGPLDSRWEYTAVVENLEIAPQSECQVASPLPPSMFCANSSVFAEDNIFAGDSGTPFQIQFNNRWYLWGIFSVGDRATNTGNYDYFSKITHFLPWIKSITNHH